MSQISWRAWGEDVFAEAAAQNKPVLLSIVAPWCNWCRAMDEQTYSNEAIAQYVSDHFIPVRVDSEKRPDINARYATGGLPSTAVLSPGGDAIWGGTFVPPDGMAQLLPQILNSFHNDKQNLAQHLAQQREQIKQQSQGPALDPSVPVTGDVTRIALLGIKHHFDLAFGGFGREQKFAHHDALELCLEQFARTADPELRLILDKTLTNMADGGLHDGEGEPGGFFRYTQTPDWREPHFAKLLEDNAQTARIYTRAFQLLGDERWKTVAARTMNYLDSMLYDAARGVWGASQDADAEYYAQPVAERAEWNPPTVDSTVICGPNALAARAHAAWWQLTGDAASLEKARKAVDFLLANHKSADGALAHFVAADDASGSVSPIGLLGDAADTCAACLDLYEAGQGTEYLDQAETIANWVRGHLEDPRSGGLFDSTIRPDAIGNLKFGTKDLSDNTQMADALLRLFLATGEEEYAHLAQRIIQSFIPALGQLGFFGAGLALAAERAVQQPILVHVLGAASDPATRALISAAVKPYRFERLVQPLDPSDPDDADHIESLGYGTVSTPTAYVCVGTSCLPPVTDPATLTETVRTAGL